MCDLAFDLVSFLAGIIAGGLTGALATILYSFERTADVQERLLKLRKELAGIDPRAASADKSKDTDSEKRTQELRAELDSIHDEIRRMYRKTST